MSSDEDAPSKGGPSSLGAAPDAFYAAKEEYKERKKDLKHRQSSLRRRQEELQQEELDTRRKHERIIEELRGQAAQSEVQVEAERQRQRAMEMELSTLRGRLAHEAKEQGQWEQDCRRREQEEMESLMIELRRLRRLHPEQAARVAAALAAEGGGDGVAQSDLLL